MPLDNVGNFARDATTASVDATQTTIPVSDASVFPDPAVAEFNVVIWDATQYPRADQDPNAEIMRVTARDTGTNELTVTRGQEGTTGASHPSGSGVINAFTAAFADDIAATDANVESFSTAGADGTVPTSQGDGTLAMESVGVDDSGNVLGGTVEGDSTNLSVHPGATQSGTTDSSVAVGRAASVSGDRAFSSGYSSTASGTQSVSIGNQSEASFEGCVAVGDSATATGENFSIAIGRGASATAGNSVALGDGASASNSADFKVGRAFHNVVVEGDFTVNGSKNFQIPHPTKPDTHDLRHGNYEGDVSGGLIYRRKVTIQTDGETGTATIHMPDWFGPLATDVDVVVQAEGHFGDAYAERTEPTGTEITVTANESGEYTCLIVATRDDENVPNPEDHKVTKPKGRRWNGDPRAYYRDAPGVDPSDYDGVERIEQFFDHVEECDPTPCPTAFENWRVTLSDGERVDVTEPMDADVQTVVDKAKAEG